MVESCYDDSIPAGASNFLKLVSKYGYCQENHYLLDPCYDLYVMMCIASVQIAIGSIQILQAIIGRIKSGNKVGDTTELNTSGPDFSLASDIGQSILGTLRLVFCHVNLSFKYFIGFIKLNCRYYCHNNIYPY